MIKIEKPYIVYDENYATLNAYLTIDNNREKVWFKVAPEYGKYLCDERADAFLIGVLNYAMRNGHDIVSDALIAEDLLYKIDTYLIDALVEANPKFYRTRIIAEPDATLLPNAGAVGTGISCGVDSLHALATEMNERYKEHMITHLTFHNVGSHGEGQRASDLFNKRISRSQHFAKEQGFQFVAGDSNLMDVVHQSHFLSHTYSSLFAVYCLQKLYSKYYYASTGHKFYEFNLVDNGGCCGEYELLSLPVFSTRQLEILSEGANKTRLEKLKKVAQYIPSYKYLNVCIEDDNNCGKCEKCIRTLLGLEVVGAVDKYREVFDVDYYYAHKKWYIKQMLYQIAQNKYYYYELYPYFRKEMTTWLYLYKFWSGHWYPLKRSLSRTKVYKIIKKVFKKHDI